MAIKRRNFRLSERIVPIAILIGCALVLAWYIKGGELGEHWERWVPILAVLGIISSFLSLVGLKNGRPPAGRSKGPFRRGD